MIEKIWTVAQIQRVFDLQTEYKIPQEVTGAVKGQWKFWMRNVE